MVFVLGKKPRIRTDNDILGGRFGYFLFLVGAGKGRSSPRQEGGGDCLFWKQRGGGFPRRGGGVVHTGAGRVSRGRGGGKRR